MNRIIREFLFQFNLEITQFKVERKIIQINKII